jgi:hypothetical protein
MSEALSNSVLDRMLEPVSRCLDAESARRIIELSTDPAVQDRVDVLAGRAAEGLLTPEERAEYEAYINADDLIAIIKMKAMRSLGLNGSLWSMPPLEPWSANGPETIAITAWSARKELGYRIADTAESNTHG